MQLKHLLVALVVLLALVGTAAAADSVEIRSSLMTTNATGTIGIQIGSTPLVVGTDTPTLNYQTWAGFFYDMNDDVSTEQIYIWQNGTGNLDIVYYTAPAFMNYAFDFGSIGTPATPLGFAIIGFFAESYVALGAQNITTNSAGAVVGNVSASRIAPLVINSDDSYLLRVGQTLELGAGYTLVPQQIDVNGSRVLLDFYYNGTRIDSSVINSAGTNTQWVYTTRVLGVNNTQVLRVNVDEVFQGTESSLVEINGLWLADYMNATNITSDNDVGEFSVRASNASLTYTAENISVSAGENIELGNGIFLRTGDNFGTAGIMQGVFYIYKEFTEEGTYEIRSQVIALPTAAVTVPQFTFANFAAFYFDINNNILPTESLLVSNTGGNNFTITYNTSVMATNYTFEAWNTVGQTANNYNMLPLFGEVFVPFNNVTSAGLIQNQNLTRIAPLVTDNDDSHLLRTGSTLELGAGYTLVVDQINVDGNQALLRFFNNGREVSSSVVSDSNRGTGNWILTQNIMGVNNTQVLRVHVDQVFQGTQDSLVEITGVWLMDFANATQLNRSDSFGILELTSISNTQLQFVAENETINRDEELLLANNMSLKTSDAAGTSADPIMFYAFVNATIGEGTPQPPQPPQPPLPPEPPEPPAPPEPPGNNGSNVTPPTPTPPSWFAQNWMYIVIALILIIAIAGAAYYFLVYKKQQA
ncbi:MAG: hypothetical protein LBE57_04025 [Methanosarcinales archaeon]|nr:hypothetical protein [Methanosarcinales archaeon]